MRGYARGEITEVGVSGAAGAHISSRGVVSRKAARMVHQRREGIFAVMAFIERGRLNGL